jgi:hypothetical protein
VRLDDNETRISGARRADVTGLGAREPPCRGFGIAKTRRKWQFSVNKAVIRWMSVEQFARNIQDLITVLILDLDLSIVVRAGLPVAGEGPPPRCPTHRSS